jgi:hypothetical protein
VDRPYPPAAPTDVLARIIAQGVSEKLGQSSSSRTARRGNNLAPSRAHRAA